MSAAACVAALQRAGIVVEPVASQVRLYNPSGPVPAEMVDAVRRYKSEILDLLAAGETARAPQEETATPAAEGQVAPAGAGEERADRQIEPESGDAGPAGDEPTAWRAWMHDRLGDRLRLGWPPNDALRLTWGQAEIVWRERHGARPDRHHCAGCQTPLAGSADMALTHGARVHWDDRHGLDCLIAYGRRWRGAAVAGLVKLGLAPPTTDRRPLAPITTVPTDQWTLHHEHSRDGVLRAEPLAPAAAIVASSDDERAAIIQFDGAAPIEWRQGLARLDPSRPPPGLTERRWRQVLDDAGRFLDQWGKLACELGWSAADLFAVHPRALDANVGLQGLCWLLEGRSVVALTSKTAVTEGRTGARLTYRRRRMRGGVVIWELVP